MAGLTIHQVATTAEELARIGEELAQSVLRFQTQEGKVPSGHSGTRVHGS